MRKMKNILIILLIITSSSFAAYNRESARLYADQWWNTDLKPIPAPDPRANKKCDHVNAPTYTWYYYENDDTGGPLLHDNGSDTIPTGYNFDYIGWDWDCANFISQCIKAGGVVMNPNQGQGGTYYRAVDLGTFLSRISEVTTISRTSPIPPNPPYYDHSKIPANVAIGDVVQFLKGDTAKHCLIIIAKGTDLTLACHSNDYNKGTIDYYFGHKSSWTKVRIFHITRTSPPSGGGGGGCVKEGTMVETPKGYKEIEEIEAGDIVIGMVGGKKQEVKVLNTFEHKGDWVLYEIYNNWMTWDHLVYRGCEYIPTIEIYRSKERYKGKVYDITTSSGNYYIGNNLLVHNKPPDIKQESQKYVQSTALKNLSKVIVYPNPYKPNSGLGHSKIIFNGLMGDVKIRIYTISGKRVREIEVNGSNGRYEWDGRDDRGEDLASGIYIYIITSGKEIAKGKIGIVR